MKQIILLPMLVLCGCANFNTTQTDNSYDKGQISRSITTKASTTTLFDANSQLAKFKAIQSDKSQSASVGSIDQSSNTTNQTAVANHLIDAVAPLLKAAP